MNNWLLVVELPLCGKFAIKHVPDGEILHQYDGEGYGDIPCDIGRRRVVAMYSKDDEIVVEVY